VPILLQTVDQGNFDLVGIREGTIAKQSTAAGENTVVDIEHREAQKREVVEDKTAGKLPQVVYTALE
jgi:hypothetical protein